MISNFRIDIVRTKYDYDRLVPASWQTVYPWNAQTGKLPLFVITPYLHDEGKLPNTVKFFITGVMPSYTTGITYPVVTPDVTGVTYEDYEFIINFAQTPDNILVMSAYGLGFYNESLGEFVYDDDTMKKVIVSLQAADKSVLREYVELTLDDCKAIADKYLRNQGKTNLANLVYRLARLAFKE